MHRLVALLAVLGLLFAVAGCSSKPDAREQELRELRELQAKIPSYYLTAEEVGDGYNLQKYEYRRLEIVECMMMSLPSNFPRINLDDIYYVSYKNPGKHRVVTLLAHKFEKSNFTISGDTAAEASRIYDEVCSKDDRWRFEVGETGWMVVHSSRVEGLNYGGFGFRAIEWRPRENTTVYYPPTQKQLEIDKRILADSGLHAYGRIGKYVVTVSIETDIQEPPSEEELKRLWDLQVEKILKHIEKEKS